MTDGKHSLFSELRRRNVFRVAVVYVVTSWVVMQIVDVMFPALNLPDRAITFVAALLIVGFPFALLFAWAFELTPEGIKRENEVDRSVSITHQTGRRLNVAIIGLLTIAVILLALNQFVWKRHGVEIAANDDRSIAVLPFVNMSEDANNEYFSDGISEEILNLLAKISELRVIGRTSSFQFKDKNEDLRVIGEKLGVSNILEGSVRKSGDTVRVTAQLIDVADGSHLWSETFDRKIDDIFAVQDEIAGAVTTALRLTLLDDPETLTEPPVNTEAYNLLLQARYHMRRREDEKALGLLEQALELDPGYAAVWADLALVYRNVGNVATVPKEIRDATDLSRAAMERALVLDPDSALTLSRKAGVLLNEWNFVAAEAAAKRAVRLAPNDIRVLGNAGVVENVMGRLEDAITLTERARKMDPLNPSLHFNLGLYLHKLGRLQDAEAEFERALELSPNFPLNRHYAKNFLLQGRLQQALSMYQEVTVEGERMLGLALVHHAMGDDSASAEAEQGLVDLEGNQAAWKLAQVYAFRGDKDVAFEWLEKAFELRDPVMGLRIKTEPLLRSLHDDPRWQKLVEKMGYP